MSISQVTRATSQTFETLPDEVLEKIILKVMQLAPQLKDQLQLRLVSRRWCQVFDNYTKLPIRACLVPRAPLDDLCTFLSCLSLKEKVDSALGDKIKASSKEAVLDRLLTVAKSQKEMYYPEAILHTILSIGKGHLEHAKRAIKQVFEENLSDTVCLLPSDIYPKNSEKQNCLIWLLINEFLEMSIAYKAYEVAARIYERCPKDERLRYLDLDTIFDAYVKLQNFEKAEEVANYVAVFETGKSYCHRLVNCINRIKQRQAQ